MLSWFYLPFLRPWFVAENLLEENLGLFKCQLLLTGNPLLLKSFLLLYLRLLLLSCNRMADLAPLVPDFSFEFNGPVMVSCTGYQNLCGSFEFLDGALTPMLGACLLDRVKNFHAVVAYSIFLGQLPKMMAASRARRLHGLLSCHFCVPLASGLRELFVRISSSHQIFDGFDFGFIVSSGHGFNKMSGSSMCMWAWRIKEVFNYVCLEYEFLWCPAWSLCKMSVHF